MWEGNRLICSLLLTAVALLYSPDPWFQVKGKPNQLVGKLSGLDFPLWWKISSLIKAKEKGLGRAAICFFYLVKNSQKQRS